jgi:hypothetical protein
VIELLKPESGGQRPRTERLKTGTSHIDVPLRCPTYLENSHPNHTWDFRSRETACFASSDVSGLWVRFPSPAPLFCCLTLAFVLGEALARFSVSKVSKRPPTPVTRFGF